MSPDIIVATSVALATVLAALAGVWILTVSHDREARLRTLEADLQALQALRPADSEAATAALVAAFGMGVALATHIAGRGAPKASGDRDSATNRPEARKGTSIDEHSVTVTTAATSGL